MLTENSYFRSVKDRWAGVVARTCRDRSQVAVSGIGTYVDAQSGIVVGASARAHFQVLACCAPASPPHPARSACNGRAPRPARERYLPTLPGSPSPAKRTAAGGVERLLSIAL